MKILCHVGPWCTKQYQAIAQGVDTDSYVTLVSGFRSVDESGLVDGYYKHYRSHDFENGSPENRLENEEIIKRCRLLRSLEYNEAMFHLLAMKTSVAEVFDRISPDLVISETVDQYLTDLIYLESKRRNIPFAGIVVSFVNGYYRLTSKGELDRYEMFWIKK